MRTLNFAKRNFKEIIRDPLSIIFAILLPMFLLFIFRQFKIPNENYELNNFTPGIIVFSLSFITLFTGMLISKDRSTSFITRLQISPMSSKNYIFGYMISIIPLVLVGTTLFLLLACVLGLNFNINILYTLLITIIISILFIGFGVIIGSIFNEKSSSLASSIIIQLVCFTGGVYFPKELLGKFFSKLCDYLPFYSCTSILKGILNNNMNLINLQNIITFIIYLIIVIILSTITMKKRINSDNK